MSLTGALEAFPLPEVLRLLARSDKSGALRIDAADLQREPSVAHDAESRLVQKTGTSVKIAFGNDAT